MALLDLRVLLLQGGASVGAWPQRWRYVWPRDASFVAAAFAAAGHTDDALAILQFVQKVQQPDGLFQARYLPDGSGPPDARGIQLDGTGWVLWAMARIIDTVRQSDLAATLASLRPLRRRCTAALLRLVDDPDALPPVSSDYWEVPEKELTLGTAAPTLLGLVAATRLTALAGEAEQAATLADTAGNVSDAVHRRFGPKYPRHIGEDDVDAAVAFLLPPFLAAPRQDVVAAFRSAESAMARPAGGLAPGSRWKNDGVSWTPETALFGLVSAAMGDRAKALWRLTWLSRHRTRWGSFPEKVLWDGSAAGPAPLAWTAALVVLIISELN